ncbi:MAG: 2-keto-4-pentenoate hydratase/2-oxohepta-3-ene-1,7-dioic acid hydratase in catechol pathway [Parvibaculaceae bacterium]|jgi:2-keto-4-pentenoate hydratase/2-oxohepta-3-ene-1,7-dioic acid hydratase in catechol pathway
MRLVTFTQDTTSTPRIGVLYDDNIVDLSQAAPSLPTDMIGLLAAGEEAMATARAATGSLVKLNDVTLQSPLLHPQKILAAGLNYKDHLAELHAINPDFPQPKVPIIFNKQTTSVTGPYAPIYLPEESAQMDYEGELAVVIGKRCRRVPLERAMEVVAGYTICNDVTIRDWQLASQTMTMGKSWDSHCPLGPALVTPDEVDGRQLDFKLFVNGEERQTSNTRELLFDIPALISHLSTAFTLEPGDVIVTGTTSGVAAFMPGSPWLKVGDVVRVEFDQLGHIENTVEADPVGAFID